MDGVAVLHPRHPYLWHSRPETYRVKPGLWKVRWRDFLSASQDAEFGSKGDAYAFASLVAKRLATIDFGLLSDACVTFSEAEQYWLEHWMTR